MVEWEVEFLQDRLNLRFEELEIQTDCERLDKVRLIGCQTYGDSNSHGGVDFRRVEECMLVRSLEWEERRLLNRVGELRRINGVRGITKEWGLDRTSDDFR